MCPEREIITDYLDPITALVRTVRVDIECRRPPPACAVYTNPKALHEVPTIETNDPRIEAMRIEIIVEHEACDPGAAIPALAEQKCPALPNAAYLPCFRRPFTRRCHSHHEQESLCCGAQRRDIVSAIEKFMYKLQVLGYPFCRVPDF